VVVLLWWLAYSVTDKVIDAGLLAALAVCAIVFFGTWNSTLVPILNMIGFRGVSVVWMTISSVSGLALSAIFAYKFHTAMSWVLGQALGLAIGSIGAGVVLRHHHVERRFVSNAADELPTLLNRQTIILYCLPLAAATGFMWLQNTGYRFLVGGVWGVVELGVLAIGLSISSQLWSIFESLAMQFLNPYFFRHVTEAKTELQSSEVLSDMVNVVWPLYAVFAGFNILFASTLLVVLTDERYHGAVVFVVFGAFIEFARCTTNLW
jgi:O-antigen/teichoic acid export membrane protein